MHGLVSFRSGNQEGEKNHKVPVNPKIMSQHVRPSGSVWVVLLTVLHPRDATDLFTAAFCPNKGKTTAVIFFQNMTPPPAPIPFTALN